MQTPTPDPTVLGSTASTGGGLVVSRLTKTFGATKALDDVSFLVERGSTHALLGGNGSGKSTLIKVLAGVLRGDAGGVIEIGEARIQADRVNPRWSRTAGFAFVHQDLGLFDALSVAENLAAGQYPRRFGRIDWTRMRARAHEELDRYGLDLDPDRPVGTLRPADQTLVAIARALQGREMKHDGLLVLDEPTARLPEEEVRRLLGALTRLGHAGQAILYVSHRLEEIFELCGTVTVLRDGALAGTREIEGLDQTALVELVVGRRPAVPKPRAAPAAAAQTPRLSVRGLTGGLVRDVDLDLAPREVLGIAGLVGAGRTTLLELIYGARPRLAGTVTVQGELLEGGIGDAISQGVAYVPEDRAGEGAFRELSIAENLSAARLSRYWRRMRFRHGRERTDAARDIDRFSIRGPGPAAALGSLSGGNQQKVVLARWLRDDQHVMLLDEPTQGVDVGARADLHENILDAVERGMSVVLVSSDLDELAALSDRVLVLADGRVVAESPTADRQWLAERIYAAARTAVPA